MWSLRARCGRQSGTGGIWFDSYFFVLVIHAICMYQLLSVVVVVVRNCGCGMLIFLKVARTVVFSHSHRGSAHHMQVVAKLVKSLP